MDLDVDLILPTRSASYPQPPSANPPTSLELFRGWVGGCGLSYPPNHERAGPLSFLLATQLLPFRQFAVAEENTLAASLSQMSMDRQQLFLFIKSYSLSGALLTPMTCRLYCGCTTQCKLRRATRGAQLVFCIKAPVKTNKSPLPL